MPFLFGVAGRPELPGPALVTLLGDLGLTPAAARALVARLRAEGSLASRRDGRAVRYRLDGTMARGFERIRTAPAPQAWEGHFHALVHQVPEEHRAFRDQLRRGATLLGFGLLTGGVLVSLRDRFDELTPLLARAPEEAKLFRCRLAMDVDDAAAAAADAWDLPGLAQVHHTRIAALDAALAASRTGSPIEGPAALRRFADVTSAAMVDLLRAPALPPELRPAEWTADRLRAAIGRVEAEWFPAVRSYVDRVLDPA